MEGVQVYRNRTSTAEWRPSSVTALATSADGSRVAAARADGSLEIWLVSPGSVGWHCQLTIQGDPERRVSSLVWCDCGSKSGDAGRLFSSSIDGSVSEWDLFSLTQKTVLDSIGVSIWQMAAEPSQNLFHGTSDEHNTVMNGHANNKDGDQDDDDSSSETDDDDDELYSSAVQSDGRRLAIACDDGCVRIYNASDSNGFTYKRSLPRVSGRVLSVAWSFDAEKIFSGSSDGIIRCWDATSTHELYRMTVGLGGSGSGPEICIWSLISLRNGTVVSADSTGSVQFWDSHKGALLQAHSHHKGDANALAATPSHNRVFSAGSDGQVILYKNSNDTLGSEQDECSTEAKNNWVYVGYVRAHTHDIRALTLAVPVSEEDSTPDDKVARPRRRQKPISFSYHKWAQMGVPMLISAGDDTKLFAYSAGEFSKFSPHDICPAPQRLPIQLVLNTAVDGASAVMVQSSFSLDILPIRLGSTSTATGSGRSATTQLLARVKSKQSRKIISSTISNTGLFFAYSDHVKPNLFELKHEVRSKRWAVSKRKLPQGLPFAHFMIFSADSSHLILAGHDRKIYVVDVHSAELFNTFVPCRKVDDMKFPPAEPPITRMFTSSDGQWLAAVNCFGDIYIFDLETRRQHWFISRLNGASVTAGGFSPGNSSILIVTTSSNKVYAFDVEAKQLGEWSRRNMFVLPRRFQEFPGEVTGLTFPPSSSSTSVIVYSARAMCLIDFGLPVDEADEGLTNGLDTSLKLCDPLKIAKLKRKWKDISQNHKPKGRKNFEFYAFKDPVLFAGHLSDKSLLIVDKQWMDVVKTFDAPVHRHIFGT
ncbi:hypothetical protein QJS10_CPB15g02043 [Acorus calamus]|uniref:Uncharacterized protein n=1 Tax=Acorus calamus TaxID=4465 RepID=A0AAV9D758_ACOCL|nr:hypothetical protein QJS10_CPB15g02043 [Acorus calamus]